MWMVLSRTHSEKFKMNRNGISILSENKSNLLLVWNSFSILLHYKCSGFFIRMGFTFLSGIKLEKNHILFSSRMIDAVLLVYNEIPFVNGHIALVKQGDDAHGSVHPSICPFVCMHSPV